MKLNYIFNLQYDIFDKQKGGKIDADVINDGVGMIGEAVEVIKELKGYFNEHTSKMNTPKNIFASWKLDDETGRNGYKGREATAWTINDGDQPVNEANAVLMYINWKGNLDVFANKVTAEQLRKKLRKTDLEDIYIEIFCDELNQLNGVTRKNYNEQTVTSPSRNLGGNVASHVITKPSILDVRETIIKPVNKFNNNLDASIKLLQSNNLDAENKTVYVAVIAGALAIITGLLIFKK